MITNFTLRCFVSGGKKSSLFFWSSFSRFPCVGIVIQTRKELSKRYHLPFLVLSVAFWCSSFVTKVSPHKAPTRGEDACQPQSASRPPSSWQCSSACNIPTSLFATQSKLLPCWKFHEDSGLPLQVFRPCASRARLHRNLPTTILHFRLFQIQTVSLHRYILLKLKQSIFSKSYPHLLIPQPSNWAPAWACPCRPCHRRPCPGSGPCREGPSGRCLCCGTWTTCWCVVALLMGLVLLRKAKVTKLSWNQFRFVKALTT